MSLLLAFLIGSAGAAVDTSQWSCGNVAELQTRLNALTIACNAPGAPKKVCRAGSGVGDSVASTVKDCVKGGMPEMTCARVVTCESGVKYCTSGGFRADTSVEAVALCVRGSIGAGAEICSQSVSCQ